MLAGRIGWTERHCGWSNDSVKEKKKEKRMKRWARFLRPPTLKRTQKLHEERAKIIGSFEKKGAQTTQETTMHRFSWWPGPKVDERGNKIASMDGWDDTHTQTHTYIEQWKRRKRTEEGEHSCGSSFIHTIQSLSSLLGCFLPPFHSVRPTHKPPSRDVHLLLGMSQQIIEKLV